MRNWNAPRFKKNKLPKWKWRDGSKNAKAMKLAKDARKQEDTVESPVEQVKDPQVAAMFADLAKSKKFGRTP